MKFTGALTIVLLGISLASCNENQPPTKAEAPLQPRSNALMQALQQGKTTYSSNINNASQVPARHELQMPGTALPTDGARASAEPAVQIPQGARWSLYCASVAGPNRIAKMTQMKAYLIAKSPFKDWYVVHNECRARCSTVFTAPLRRATARGARTQIGRRSRVGRMRPVTTRLRPASLRPLPPLPPLPAEWNLANANARAYWSVQIAAFKDNAQASRRRSAWCRKLAIRGWMHITIMASR